MPVSVDEVLKNLRSNVYVPFYFLQGDEPYYIDLISDFIEKNALSEDQKSFNQIILYGRDVSMTDVLSNARRFPMMSERQVVMVKEAQEMGDLKRQEASEMLSGYAKNPVPSTILVFCHKYKTLDGRKGLAKDIDKLGILVTTKKMYDNQLAGWIGKYVESKGFKIDLKAQQMVADFVGNDLERIVNEFDKLLTNFKEKIEITPEHIQRFIGISKEYNPFELQRAISSRNVTKANEIVKYYASNPKNNPVLPLITVLYSFFSKLLVLHSASDKSERRLASSLKVNPYFVKEYISASRNYPLGKTAGNIGHIRQADLQLKGFSGNISEGDVLKELVYKLMH
ncbi:MAG: DNA polymerase III subunit delta [Bacteroidota bacterium]